MSEREVVIFDIDGTIADLSHRLHHIQGDKKDWEKFHANVHDDEPIFPIISIMDALYLSNRYDFVFCTGRMEHCREATQKWLNKYGVDYHFKLMMRPNGDHRPDFEVKKEMLQELREEGCDVAMVFEDRSTVVKMWREAGIPCLQVAEGDF